jgi:hypothetical protein
MTDETISTPVQPTLEDVVTGYGPGVRASVGGIEAYGATHAEALDYLVTVLYARLEESRLTVQALSNPGHPEAAEEPYPEMHRTLVIRAEAPGGWRYVATVTSLVEAEKWVQEYSIRHPREHYAAFWRVERNGALAHYEMAFDPAEPEKESDPVEPQVTYRLSYRNSVAKGRTTIWHDSREAPERLRARVRELGKEYRYERITDGHVEILDQWPSPALEPKAEPQGKAETVIYHVRYRTPRDSIPYDLAWSGTSPYDAHGAYQECVRDQPESEWQLVRISESGAEEIVETNK